MKGCVDEYSECSVDEIAEKYIEGTPEVGTVGVHVDDTLKELAAALGKETIDSYNTGESRGREVSHSLNYQKLGKELMSVDELAVLDGGKCILQLRGVRPFLSNKYDLTKHPLYRYTADYDKKYAFDIERFLSHRLKLKPDDAVEVYPADLSGEPVA